MWKGLEALPAPGKVYQHGFKLVNDRLPEARQRVHRAAEYWRGNDSGASKQQAQLIGLI